MPIFKEHFPSSFELEFETLDDLLNIDCNKKWTENPWGEEFYRFSIKDDRRSIFYLLEPNDNYLHLMVEMNGGTRKYILGDIYGSSPEEIGLPEYIPKYERIK